MQNLLLSFTLLALSVVRPAWANPPDARCNQDTLRPLLIQDIEALEKKINSGTLDRSSVLVTMLLPEKATKSGYNAIAVFYREVRQGEGGSLFSVPWIMQYKLDYKTCAFKAVGAAELK